MGTDQSRQDLNDLPRANASRHIDCQALAGVFIVYRQALQLLTIAAAVEYEVIGPNLLRLLRCQGTRPVVATLRRDLLRGILSFARRHRRWV